jgi:hypothetical protein
LLPTMSSVAHKEQCPTRTCCLNILDRIGHRHGSEVLAAKTRNASNYLLALSKRKYPDPNQHVRLT